MVEKQKKDVAPPGQDHAQPGGAWDKEHPFMQRAPYQAAGAVDASSGGKDSGVKAEKLATGDELINLADGQILKMPNGEKLAIVKDPIIGGTSVEVVDKNGDPVELTYKATIATEPAVEVYQLANGARLEARPDVGKLTYPNEDEIVYDRSGICSIRRGGKTVHLHDPQYDEIQPIVDPNRKFKV